MNLHLQPSMQCSWNFPSFSSKLTVSEVMLTLILLDLLTYLYNYSGQLALCSSKLRSGVSKIRS